MQSQCYYLEVDDEVCFKAGGIDSDSESYSAETPVGKSASPSRRALQVIDSNIIQLQTCINTPMKPPLGKPVIDICKSPERLKSHCSERVPASPDDEDKFYEAQEGPPLATSMDNDAENIAPRPAPTTGLPTTPSKTPSKTQQGAEKTPKSFFKKILNWGSSVKYPPNTPVEKAAVDATADRITGEYSSENSAPDYLTSPPKSMPTQVSSVQKESVCVNRALVWQDVEPAVEATSCTTPSVEKKTVGEIDGDEFTLAVEDVTLESARGKGSNLMDRRGSGIGLSLATSMSHAEALLLNKRRTSNELTLSYGDSDEHLPIYSQAEYDSALENLRYELQADFEKQKAESSPLESIESQQICNEPAEPRQAVMVESDRVELLEAELTQQKMQAAALYHQVKLLNGTISKLEVAAGVSRTKHEAELEAMAQLSEQRTKQTYDESTSALTAKLNSVSTAQLEAVKQVDALKATIEMMNKREAEMEASKLAAVAEAKARVYEKAQKQFEQGNMEYQRVLAELAAMKQESETGHATNKQLQNNLERVSSENLELARQLRQQQEKDAEISACFADVVPSSGELGLLTTCKTVSAMVAKLTKDVASSVANADTLQQQIITEMLERRKLTESLQASEALVSANVAEVSKLRAELRTQEEKHMTIYARAVTDNKQAEEKLQQLTELIAQRDERVASLRAMNEELLGMLEAGADS